MSRFRDNRITLCGNIVTHMPENIDVTMMATPREVSETGPKLPRNPMAMAEFQRSRRKMKPRTRIRGVALSREDQPWSSR